MALMQVTGQAAAQKSGAPGDHNAAGLIERHVGSKPRCAMMKSMEGRPHDYSVCGEMCQTAIAASAADNLRGCGALS